MDIFELDREGENERYDTTIGNDMMLWHGSVIKIRKNFYFCIKIYKYILFILYFLNIKESI